MNSMENQSLTVDLGMLLEIELLDRSDQPERLQVTIVPDQAADYRSGLLGESTLLAKTLLGQPAGVRLAYKAGDLVAVRILTITPAPGPLSDEQSASRRQEEVARIQREVAQRNAANFAASFSGKWGDYDPDGVDHWEK